jgi:hypothetical protein
MQKIKNLLFKINKGNNFFSKFYSKFFLVVYCDAVKIHNCHRLFSGLNFNYSIEKNYWGLADILIAILHAEALIKYLNCEDLGYYFSMKMIFLMSNFMATRDSIFQVVQTTDYYLYFG